MEYLQHIVCVYVSFQRASSSPAWTWQLIGTTSQRTRSNLCGRWPSVTGSVWGNGCRSRYPGLTQRASTSSQETLWVHFRSARWSLHWTKNFYGRMSPDKKNSFIPCRDQSGLILKKASVYLISSFLNFYPFICTFVYIMSLNWKKCLEENLYLQIWVSVFVTFCTKNILYILDLQLYCAIYYNNLLLLLTYIFVLFLPWWIQRWEKKEKPIKNILILLQNDIVKYFNILYNTYTVCSPLLFIWSCCHAAGRIPLYYLSVNSFL